jgi:hypothetical protein
VAYTLRQAVLRTGLTKSTIQRYFKDPPLKFRQAEVNKDNDKNTEWTLTDDDMEVLWQIKIYQSLGLRRPDVIKILSKTPIERQKELDKAIKSLEQKIEEAKLYSTTRINYFDKKIDSNEIQSIMKEVIKTVKSEYHKIEDLNIYKYQFSEDDDINSDKYLLELKELSGTISPDDSKALTLIKKVDDIVYKVNKEKITRFDSIKEGILDLDIDNSSKEFMIQALTSYFNNIVDDSKNLSSITLNIMDLAKKGEKTTSAKVKNEVQKIWNYYDDIGYNHVGISFLLQVFIKFFQTEEIKKTKPTTN